LNWKLGFRVVVKLKSVSFQWCTLRTVSRFRFVTGRNLPRLDTSVKRDIQEYIIGIGDMRYTLRQLEVFLAVARHESVSRAGDELAMSQSAVSGALADLERQFDVQLFDRVGKRLRLNGLGRSVRARAEALAAQGATVIVNYVRGEAAARECADAIVQKGGKAEIVGFDVADTAATEKAIEGLIQKHGKLDVLVANAAYPRGGDRVPLVDLPEQTWRTIVDVNLTGTMLCCQHVARRLIAQGEGGSLVAISSIAAMTGTPTFSAYAASKAAVISLARSLSVELGPHRIRVNAIAPGVVAGDRIRRVFTDRAATRGITYEQMEQIALRAVSLKTAVEPEEIAALVMFLCAPTGRAITGQVHSICGGLEYTE